MWKRIYNDRVIEMVEKLKVTTGRDMEFDIEIPELKAIERELIQINKNLEILNNTLNRISNK
jgi:hypothetical protein